jgi:hypothetical protein
VDAAKQLTAVYHRMEVFTYVANISDGEAGFIAI